MDDPGSVVVPCGPLKATMPLRACLLRHVKVWPSGGGRGSPYFPLCARCPAGRLRLREADWFVPPRPSMPAELPSRTQRDARLRWARSFPGYAPPSDGRLDALHEAALATPDDGGIEADVSGLG